MPIDDQIYRQLDTLIAHHLITDAIYMQRPWSRAECARLTGEAMEHAHGLEETSPADAYVAKVREALAQEFAPEIAALHNPNTLREFSFNALREAQITVSGWHAPTRVIPADPGVGELRDGVVSGLAAYRSGFPPLDGPQIEIATQQDLRAGRHVSCDLTARALVGYDTVLRDGAQNLAVHAGGCDFTLGPIEMAIGREPTVWGENPRGGLLFSTNARSMESLRISTTHPFYHPWIFRHLGPSKYTLVVDTLGPEYFYPWSTLVGFIGTMHPHPSLEFGAEHTYMLGGRGAPPLHWADPLTEFFLVRAPGIAPTSVNVADHRVGIHVRWEIPKTRGTTLYVEGVADDIGRTDVLANFTDTTGYILGVFLPRVDDAGRTTLRAEYRDLPAMLYRHSEFQQGYTLNHHLLGDPLGPDARSLEFTWTREWTPQIFSELRASWQQFHSDQHTQTIGSGGGPNQVYISMHQPGETRYTVQGHFAYDVTPRANFFTDAGYSFVHQANFVPSLNRNFWMASVGMQFRFGEQFALRRNPPSRVGRGQGEGARE